MIALMQFHRVSCKQKKLDTFSPLTLPLAVNEREDDMTTSAIYSQAELLRWYYWLGDRSFSTIRLLAQLPIIPYCLRNVRLPKCACFIYVAMTRTPWRMKGISNQGKIFPTTSPGQCVSVDQLERFTPGFVGQIKGYLTRQRYMHNRIPLPFFGPRLCSSPIVYKWRRHHGSH